MFDYFMLMVKSATRNRRRCTLTVASVAISICLLGVLMAIFHALFLKQQTPAQAQRLVVRNRISIAQSVPSRYEDKIRAVPGVTSVSSWNWFNGRYKDNQTQDDVFGRYGVEPDAFFTLRPQLQMPEEQRQAFLTERTACIITQDLADKLKLRIGDRVYLEGDVWPANLDLTVRGIFKDPDSISELYFNMAYLRDQLPAARRNSDGMFVALTESSDAAPKIAKSIDAVFANFSPPTKTESEEQFGLSVLSMLGNVKLYLIAICAAVSVALLLVTANAMAMSTRERIKEIGILKTLGFRKQEILTLILGESVALATIGAAIGVILSSMLTAGIAQVGAVYLGQLNGMSLGLAASLLSLLMGGSIGLLGALFPAWSAANVSIIESIRSVG